MGLGLYVTVTADGSMHGQGGLPTAMGQVNCCYYSNSPNISVDEGDRSSLQEITLSLREKIVEPSDTSLISVSSTASPDDADQEAKKKRRRVSSSSTKKETKLTAELFFLAIDKAGGKEDILSNHHFSLLADIRLARGFHSQTSHIKATVGN
jgi:hypothetical protein